MVEAHVLQLPKKEDHILEINIFTLNDMPN